MSDVAQELRALQGSWKKAEERPQQGFSSLPDGPYPDSCISDALIGHSKKGRLQVTWSIKVKSGAYKGKVVKTFQGIENQQNLEWLKTTLAALGLTAPKNLKNLPKTLEAAIGKDCSITVKQNGQFSNIYINKAQSSAVDDELDMDDENDGDDEEE